MTKLEDLAPNTAMRGVLPDAYLPRLKNPDVLLASVMDGLGLTTWRQDSFASADSYDDKANRFRGLLCGRTRGLAEADAPGMVVKAEAALRQIEAEKTPPPVVVDGKKNTTTESKGFPAADGEPPLPPPPLARKPKRFHNSVALDPALVTSAAGVIAESVIVQLSALVGSNVSHPGDRGRGPYRRPRQHHPHRHRERPHLEVHDAWF
jgi:hypothetical protein